MTFLPGFLHDVFISYTHLDDEPDEQGVRWVTAFRGHIETALRQRLGGEVSVFFDLSHFRAQDELEFLLTNARQSAVFLPVFSPNYAKRPWTLDELAAFDGASSAAGPELAGVNRIVAIEILPVEEDEVPARLARLKRTRFYYEDKISRASHRLSATRKNEVDGERITDIYGERIGDLSCNLVELLRDLNKRLKTSAPAVGAPIPARAAAAAVSVAAAPKPVAHGKTILLAQATDDLYDECVAVQSYLTQFGATVLPVGEYPAGGAEFASAFRADLDKSDLFVQLLSTSRSRVPFDLKLSEREPAQSYSWFQFEAAKRRREPIPILQWHRPDIDPEKVTHQDKQLLTGADVRVMGLQEFMKTITETIRKDEEKRRKDEEKQKQQAATGSDGGFYFINAYDEDASLANMLAEAFQSLNRQAFLPMFKGSAAEKDSDVDENLLTCDGVLLLFGEAPVGWVRAQLRRYIKIAGMRERAPRYKKLVLAPGAQPGEIGARTTFEEVDCRDGAITDRIRQLVGELCLS
jgi:hypothetical protein